MSAVLPGCEKYPLDISLKELRVSFAIVTEVTLALTAPRAFAVCSTSLNWTYV